MKREVERDRTSWRDEHRGGESDRDLENDCERKNRDGERCVENSLKNSPHPLLFFWGGGGVAH